MTLTHSSAPSDEFCDTSLDYSRIAQAIEFIRSHTLDQPSLAEVASSVSLSESHLQRLFSRWAGVSPKRFLQLLTLDHAQTKLRKSAHVLSASLEVGLSGPSRLHDLFVTLEAVSPGEFKDGGKTLEIAYGFHSTPLGLCAIAVTPRGICRLEFIEDPHRHEFIDRLQKAWPEAHAIESAKLTEPPIAQIFHRSPRPRTSFTALVRGTNFQVQVWRALLRIPMGHAVSYGRLAEWVGAPRANRAVGTAVGNNPISYLIPCHRVLRSDGGLGGYRWGVTRKSALLIREDARQDEDL